MNKKKSQEDVQIRRFSVQIWVAVAMAATGIILLFASFIVPPTGVIDPSVIACLAEVLTFSGSCLGIDGNYKLKNRRLELEYDEKMRQNEAQ